MTPPPQFFLMAAAAILFLKDLAQKLIRSSQIPREQLYQIWMQSNQRFIRYRAHRLFRFWLGAKKKYMGRIALLRIRPRRRRRRRQRRQNAKHYKHPDIHRRCLINQKWRLVQQITPRLTGKKDINQEWWSKSHQIKWQELNAYWESWKLNDEFSQSNNLVNSGPCSATFTWDD